MVSYAVASFKINITADDNITTGIEKPNKNKYLPMTIFFLESGELSKIPAKPVDADWRVVLKESIIAVSVG